MTRALCPYCEATPDGCRSLTVLAGRCCCTTCERHGGDHDHPTKEARTA